MTINELGNTTLEDLGILTGKAGHIAALAEPESWEASGPAGIWHPYSGGSAMAWGKWDNDACRKSDTRWRRKPEMKRDPLQYATASGVGLNDGIVVGEPHGRYVDVSLRFPAAWYGKAVSIVTTEPIVDKPEVPRHPCRTIPESELVDVPQNEPTAEQPGSIITWQRAQERVDAGLAVETPVDLNEKYDAWAAVGSDAIGSKTPAEYPHWTYRIPLQPAQPEAVTMTWREALDWIGDLSVTGRMVLNKEGYACNIPRGDGAPYRPILFATRSQVEMEREIDDLKKQVAARDRRPETKRTLDDRDEAEWKAFVEWSQNRYNDKALEDKTFAICGMSHLEAARKTIEGLSALVDAERTTLASAIGSQKAAEAALEVERKRGEKLRHKTECLVRRITGTGTRDIVRDVVALLNESEFSESTKSYLQSDEISGKESG